jgi:hypothetical protein
MKMTLVTDSKGALVAAQQSAILPPGKHTGAGAVGGLVAGPGQSLHEVDVPDTLARAQDPAVFLKGIQPFMPRVPA